MNFFSKLFKHKKIISLVILFFIGSGIVIPQVAHADGLLPTVLGATFDPIGLGIAILGGGNGNWTLDKAGAQVAGAAANLLIGLCMYIESLGASLLNQVLGSTMMQGAITKQAIVITGWTAVRDFANMLIVLGFVVVAISLILRIGEYGSTKTLFTLIVVALLINFSMLICGVIIDGTNITMNYFLTAPVNQNGASGITGPLGGNDTLGDKMRADVEKTIEATGGTDWKTLGALVGGDCLYAIIAAMLFIIYAALFLFREVALMCLVILSPLAFFCFVFPATKQIWQKWWSQFTQWAIIGIPAAFFIYLGTKLIQADSFVPAQLTPGASPPSLLAFFIPAAFMYFAYTLTFQISAIGASGAIGLATGAMGYAMGAGKVGGRALGGMADKVTGNRISGAGHAVAGGVTRIGERLGLVKEGTAATAQAGRRDDAKKTMDALRLSSNAGDRAKYENYVRNGRGIKGASAVALANENKEFGRIMNNNLPAMRARAGYAQQFGYRQDDFEKKMPSHAANNATTIARLLNTMNPVTGVNYNEYDAGIEAIRQKFAGMGATDIQELHQSQVTSAGTIAMNSRAFNRASINLNADQSNAYKALLPQMTIDLANLNAQIMATPAGPRRATLQRQWDNGQRIFNIINAVNF